MASDRFANWIGVPRPGGLSNRASSPRRERSYSDNRSGVPSTEFTLGSYSTPPSSSRKKRSSSSGWTGETSGRRVGYDENSSIDWTFEYTQERLRLRSLIVRGDASNHQTAVGLAGHLRQLVDSSQIWIVLIATGLTIGATAAFIDVVSDWLADLKIGFCSDMGSGGRFYLSRGFCCWGYDDLANCKDWRTWGTAIGASSFEWILFAVTASFLVFRYANYAKHSGIPELKAVLGGLVMREFLGPWTLLIKSLGLCLSCASGLWLGKEGPLVHVACCFAEIFSQLSPALRRNEARKREVFSAASAAGFSAAFGSPIGGVLFSLEQISYYFPDTTMWQSFVTAMIGAVTLQFLNPFRTGKLVLYQVTYHHGWNGFEMIPYALIGILGGLHGGLFIRLNRKLADLRRQWQTNRFPIVEVFLIALATALIGFPIRLMRAQATQMLYILFAECADIPNDDSFGLCQSGVANTGAIFSLLITAMFGFFLAAATFGSLIPAGVLLPSMALGALYGRAIGLAFSVLQTSYPRMFLFASCGVDGPCIRPGTYAIIGAASALAGTTRMVVSTVVIMFELTGALTYALPIMIAAIISKWVGDAISRWGIYESWIRYNNYPLLDNRDDDWGNGGMPDIRTAAEAMATVDELVVISAQGHTIESLQSLLQSHPYNGFPVVFVSSPSNDSCTPGGTGAQNDSMPSAPGFVSPSGDRSSARLIGYISRKELDAALASALASPKRMPPSTEVSFLAPSRDRQPEPVPPSSLESPATDSSLDFRNTTPHNQNHDYNPHRPILNLQSWVDHTAITLDVKSSFQLTVNMFQRLGLRYVLFVEQGYLRGMLTKKDIWLLVNGGLEGDEPAGPSGSGGGVNERITTADRNEDGPALEFGYINADNTPGYRSHTAGRGRYTAVSTTFPESYHAGDRVKSPYSPT